MANIKWLLQSTNVNRNLNNEDWFIKNVDFIDFGLIPFSNEITNLSRIYQDWIENPNTSYMVRGGTKILKVFLTDGIYENQDKLSVDFPNHDFTKFFTMLKDSFFYDYEKFDQDYYQKLDLPLLNKGAISVVAEKAKYMQFSENKFVKPTSDRKSFVGKILFPGETIEQMILSTYHNESVWQETILIAPEKKVLKEWRFFVLNGEIITGSQYFENHSLKVKELTTSKDDQNALVCANEYAKLYSPSDLFTLDICLEENNNWSIVEYNCFHCSGLYKANLPILKNVVEDFISNKQKRKYGYKKI